jgi:hypothetical protein
VLATLFIVASYNIEAWVIIDFKNPGFHFGIDKNIKAEDLERHSFHLFIIFQEFNLVMHYHVLQKSGRTCASLSNIFFK